MFQRGFQALPIESEYRSFRMNVVKDFFIPVLSETIIYKRAVGFFSSSSLIEVSRGITGLVRNNGVIQLICSPCLTNDDFAAIQRGYSEREQVFASLKRELLSPSSDNESDRLNLLANLIKNGNLDIRIAVIKSNLGLGIYHEKMGIVKDLEGNLIAFSGSLNESQTAFNLNYEAIDVFCSWKSQDQLARINSKHKAFDSLWNGSEPNIETLEIPEVKEEIISRYLRRSPTLDIDEKEVDIFVQSTSRESEKKKKIRIPENVRLYPYQIEAIEEWQNKNFNGIFDMATGTGKTITAIGGMVKLYDATDGKLTIFIVCPFQHLVEQWVEELEPFGIKPIIGYSRSSQRDWRNHLVSAINDQKLGVKNKEFLCFITTNATFRSNEVQKQIQKVKGNTLLVVDEAHNFGAESIRELLPSNFKYRLALSATLERHNDDIGTQALFDYFGSKCIEYSLEKAISENKLTEYYYYPVLVPLAPDELEVYIEITNRISKCIIVDKAGKTTLTQLGKQLAIKRARLVAGAKNKISKLQEIIQPYLSKSHILVYCGAANVLEPDQDELLSNDEEIRQIDLVTLLLGNQLNMKVSQFTSKEDIVERKILKHEFEKGEKLQVLIAIKCLDEGVNIPKIKTAFILASTTNPKEYIQRRGRLLRLAEGKSFSEIFDFITIPYELQQVPSLTLEQLDQVKTLIRNELARGHEFANIALNTFEAKQILTELEEAYRITDVYFDLGG